MLILLGVLVGAAAQTQEYTYKHMFGPGCESDNKEVGCAGRRFFTAKNTIHQVFLASGPEALLLGCSAKCTAITDCRGIFLWTTAKGEARCRGLASLGVLPEGKALFSTEVGRYFSYQKVAPPATTTATTTPTTTPATTTTTTTFTATTATVTTTTTTTTTATVTTTTTATSTTKTATTVTTVYGAPLRCVAAGFGQVHVMRFDGHENSARQQAAALSELLQPCTVKVEFGGITRTSTVGDIRDSIVVDPMMLDISNVMVFKPAAPVLGAAEPTDQEKMQRCRQLAATMAEAMAEQQTPFLTSAAAIEQKARLSKALVATCFRTAFAVADGKPGCERVASGLNLLIDAHRAGTFQGCVVSTATTTQTTSATTTPTTSVTTTPTTTPRYTPNFGCKPVGLVQTQGKFKGVKLDFITVGECGPETDKNSKDKCSDHETFLNDVIAACGDGEEKHFYNTGYQETTEVSETAEIRPVLGYSNVLVNERGTDHCEVLANALTITANKGCYGQPTSPSVWNPNPLIDVGEPLWCKDGLTDWRGNITDAPLVECMANILVVRDTLEENPKDDKEGKLCTSLARVLNQMTYEYEIQNGENGEGNWNTCTRTTPTTTPKPPTTPPEPTTPRPTTTVADTTTATEIGDNRPCSVSHGLPQDADLLFDDLKKLVEEDYTSEANATINLAIIKLQIWSTYDRWT